MKREEKFIQHLAVLPATWIDNKIPHWDHTNHHKCSRQYKLSWLKIFGRGSE